MLRIDRTGSPAGLHFSDFHVPPDDAVRLATAILDSALEGLAVLDGDLNVLTANQIFFRLFGIDEPTPGAVSVDALGLGTADGKALHELVRHATAKAERQDLELVRQGELGPTHLKVSLRRLDVPEVPAAKLLLAIHDVSEFRAVEEELNAFRIDLEERVRRRTAQLTAANEELEAFAYAVSHDLRAPLRAMTGFSAALVEDFGTSLDASGREYIKHIEDAASLAHAFEGASRVLIVSVDRTGEEAVHPHRAAFSRRPATRRLRLRWVPPRGARIRECVSCWDGTK
jgi:signal transduction histidine kinase